jgi:hypothetical protein
LDIDGGLACPDIDAAFIDDTYEGLVAEMKCIA